jgi:ABC-type transport system involved in multi-copper enzyme maturation permease subunit
MYALRVVLIALLGGGLASVWWAKLAGRPMTIRDLAATGESFFYALAGVQLSLILLLAPAYTAGSVCLDKVRGTLAHLLVTDLSDTELVLGKLAARLLPVLGLVACSVPVLFAAILLGGIDPEAAIGAVLVTLGVGVLGSALALVLSVWGRKPHEVLLASYLVLAILILIDPIWGVLAGRWGFPGAPLWLRQTNPYLMAFLPYWRVGQPALPDQAVFLGVALAISCLFILVAVFRVRAVTLRQLSRPARFSPVRRLADRFRLRIGWLPGPSLDRNPVLWREWHGRRPSRWTRVTWLLYGLVAGALSLTVAVMALQSPVGGMRGPLPPWVNALQVPIGLLLLSVASVTALAEERVRGTLDVLLTTPLSTRSILWGKWWGTYRSVPWLIWLPLLVAGSVAFANDHWSGVLLVAAMVLVYGAAVTSWGLALATWIARLGRALAVSVSLFVLATVGPFVPLLLLMRQGQRYEWLAEGSPFFGMGAFTDLLSNQGGMGSRYQECLHSLLMWGVAYLVVAAVLFILTVLTFDGCLGRMPERGRLRRPQLSRAPHFETGRLPVREVASENTL